MREMKRMITSKFLLLIGIVLTFCAIYYVVRAIGTDGLQDFHTRNLAYKQAIDDIKNMNQEDIDEYILTLRKIYGKDFAEDIKNDAIYINAYPTKIEKILFNAQINQNMPVFVQDNQYNLDNMKKTYDDYNRVRNIKPEMIPTKGFNLYTDSISVFSGCCLMIMLYCLFHSQKEFDNGEILFTHTAKYGRFVLSLKRNVSFVILTIIINATIEFVMYLLTNILYGYIPVRVPIQSSSLYEQCTYKITIGQFLIGNALLTGVGIAVIVLIANAFLNICRNKYIAMILFGATMFIEWRTSLLVQNNSSHRRLANINVFRLMDFSCYLRKYQNVKVFDKPYSACLAMLVCMIFVLIVFFGICSFVYMRRYPFSSVYLRGISTVIQTWISKILMHMHFSGIEIYKILFRKKRYVFIVATFLFEIILIYHTRIDFPQRQKQMDEIYMEYGGADWNQFNSYINELKEEADDMENRCEEVKNSFDDGEMRFLKMEEIASLEFSRNEIMKKLEEYEQIQQHHQKILRDQNIDTYAMSSRGYNEIIGSNSYVRELGIMGILVALITILSSGLFLEERTSGVLKIMKCSQKGLKRIYRKKYLILFGVIILLVIIIYGIDMVSLRHMYNLPYKDAPLISLGFMQDKMNNCFRHMTIKQFLWLDVLYKGSIGYVTMVVSIIFSKNSHVNSLFFVPIVVCMMGIIGCIGILSSIMIKLCFLVVALCIGALFTIYMAGGFYEINDK